MSNWHTGEWIWAGVALLMVVMTLCFTIAMFVDWVLHPQRPNKLADLKQLVGTNLLLLVMATGFVAFGSYHYWPSELQQINWPDGRHQLLGVIVAIGVQVLGIAWIYLGLRAIRRRVPYWELMFTPWLALLLGVQAVAYGALVAFRWD